MSDEAPPPPPPPQDAATAGTSARPSHRLRRSAAVIAGVAVVAAGVVVGVVLTRPHGAQSAAVTAGVSEPRLTIPETIMAAHGDENGVLDFEGALELFSYAYTPLPGVILPAGAPDVPAHWVSQAAEAISTHLGELTPAQRAVVLMYFQDVTGSGSPIQAAPAAVHSGVTADLMGLTPATYVRQDIANLVAKAFSDEAAKLGHTIGDAPANTSLAHVYLYLTQKAMDGAAAWTVATAGRGYDSNGEPLPTRSQSGKITDCSIFVPPDLWGSSSNGHWISSEDDVASIYHEVFHCYQYFVLGSITGDVANATPQWIIEGGAAWAEGSIVPENLYWWETGVSGFDTGYLPTPRTPLSWRSYSGMGVLFEVEHLGRPLWPLWWSLWSSAAGGGWSTGDWFNQVSGPRYASLLDSWASSFYLENGEYEWTTGGTGQHPTAGVKPQGFNGVKLMLTTQSYATYQVVLFPPKQTKTVVEMTSSEPNMRFQDQTQQQDVSVGVAFLCWAQSCAPPVCPRAPAGTSPPQVTHVTGQVQWGYTSTKPGIATMAALTQQQYCKLSKPRPPQAPTPCPEECAGSNGDPHVHTVTGPHYEFQAAGEYVLLRSPDGSLEVQGRQEPMPGSAVTINTAAAVNLGAHRASVYFDSASQALVVHVDGQPVTLSAPMAVGGGTLRPVSSGVEIDAADGTRVWLLGFPSHPKYGINIQVLPSAALRGKASGVLGDVPLGYITPLLPDGTGRRVSADPIADYTFTYQTFAPAWRVTDTDTLFDYAAGQNTESFTVPGFVPLGGPPKPVPFGGTFGLDPSARAASETACAGVANVELRNDCVFDVTASGDSGFVQSYANTATFLATQTGAPPAAAPAPSGGPTIKPLLTGFSGVYGAAVGPDGALDVVVTLPSGPAILAVDPATTTIRTQQSLNAPSAASLAVAAGSLWVVVGAQTPAGCAVDRVDPASLTVTGHLTPPACPEIGSHNLAGAGDQLWMLGSGSPKDQLQRIDTSSLTVAQTIPVTANLIGALYASATSVFCTGESEVDRIDAASGSLVKLDDGTDSTTFAGDGIWEEPDVGDLAFIDSYHTIAKHLSIPTQGEKLLVGADEQNVYLEEEDNKAVLQLPIDGSQGMSLGTSDQLGGTGESAFIVGSRNIFRVYGAPASQGGAFSLFVENFPLP